MGGNCSFWRIITCTSILALFTSAGQICIWYTAYNMIMDGGLRSNLGKTFTIYDISELVEHAHHSAITPRNVSWFENTGICPYNHDCLFPKYHTLRRWLLLSESEDDFTHQPVPGPSTPAPSCMVSNGTCRYVSPLPALPKLAGTVI